ncbi:MAG TPA: tripartite tricarboxylate transporter substrate binding protein [Vicinamibacterales bacterium]
MRGGLFIVALVLSLALRSHLSAQVQYPKSVVSLVTHSSPGGGSDVFLREMVPHLTRIMRVTFVVENLQGGSGAKAMAILARAKPDGGMFYATTPTFIYTSLLSKPASNHTDLEPLVNIFYDPEVVYTAADSRFKTLKDVIDRARQGGGRWGAANPASLERQVMERIKQRAGVRPAVATFEGGGALLINVLNHTLDMGIGELQEIRTQLEIGKIRLLGVVADQRLPQFPELKTVREQGIDVSVRKFRGLAGPKGTSREVIAAWEAAIPRLLEDSRYKQLYTENGLQPGFVPHAEYVRFMDAFAKETTAFLKESGVIR